MLMNVNVVKMLTSGDFILSVKLGVEVLVFIIYITEINGNTYYRSEI